MPPPQATPDATTTTNVDKRSCFWRYITALTRTWGLLSVVGLWALTVQAFREKEKDVYTHWYILAVSPVITFLEVLWIFNKCACCKYDEGCCCKFWHGLLWIDGWKKTVLYTLFSIPCFLKGEVAKWSVIYGVVVLVLAVFYLLKSIGACCYKDKSAAATATTKKKESSRAPDDPRSSLVQREVVPGQSSQTYSSTGTTPPPTRANNPDWPPEGYVVGPDGTLQPVQKEPEVVKPKKRDENYKVPPSETRSEWPPPGYRVAQDGTLQEEKKTTQDADSFEPETATWPPPGFEVGPDGLLKATNPGQSTGRNNPFNKGPR